MPSSHATVMPGLKEKNSGKWFRGCIIAKVHELPATLWWSVKNKRVIFQQFKQVKLPWTIEVVPKCHSMYNQRVEVHTTPSK